MRIKYAKERLLKEGLSSKSAYFSGDLTDLSLNFLESVRPNIGSGMGHLQLSYPLAQQNILVFLSDLPHLV